MEGNEMLAFTDRELFGEEMMLSVWIATSPPPADSGSSQ